MLPVRRFGLHVGNCCSTDGSGAWRVIMLMASSSPQLGYELSYIGTGAPVNAGIKKLCIREAAVAEIPDGGSV
jgi:hypothetical protein